MVITTTAVGFITLAVGLGICGLWFTKAFRKIENPDDKKIGKLLSILFWGLSLQNGTMGLGAALFTQNSKGLYISLILGHLFLAGVASLGIYITYYIFFPKKSLIPALTFVIVLGILVVIGTIFTYPKPFLTAENGIDWGMNPGLSIAVFYLLLVNIGCTLYIFGRLSMTVRNSTIKNLSLTLSALGFVGILNAFIRLIVFGTSQNNLRTSFFDFISAVIGILFIVMLIIMPIMKTLLINKPESAGNN